MPVRSSSKGCGFLLVLGGFYGAIVCAALYVSALCFQYSLNVLVGKDVPFYADILGGIVTGGLTIPATVLLWIATLCGVHTPIFTI